MTTWYTRLRLDLSKLSPSHKKLLFEGKITYIVKIHRPDKTGVWSKKLEDKGSFLRNGHCDKQYSIESTTDHDFKAYWLIYINSVCIWNNWVHNFYSLSSQNDETKWSLAQLDKVTVVSSNAKITPVKISGLPWLIATSKKNTLYADDTHHTLNGTLPQGFSYNKQLSLSSDFLRTATKVQLLEELQDLMSVGNLKAIGREWKNFGSPSNDMLQVSHEMADYFVKNTIYNRENAYSNQHLNNAVSEATNFINYRDNITKEIKKVFIKDSMKFIRKPPLEVDRFALNSFSDKINGLVITIDQVAKIDIYIDEITYIGDEVSALRIRYEMFDTYGLDERDLDKFGLCKSGSVEGISIYERRSPIQKAISTAMGASFNAWYLLQYKYNCIPFMVKMVVYDEVKF